MTMTWNCTPKHDNEKDSQQKTHLRLALVSERLEQKTFFWKVRMCTNVDDVI